MANKQEKWDPKTVGFFFNVKPKRPWKNNQGKDKHNF